MADDDERVSLLRAPDRRTTPAVGTLRRQLVRKCLAEFIATGLFVFIGTASVVTSDNLTIATAHGLTIALLIASFGDVSGAHINPVVTLGILLATNLIHWLHAIFYIISQVLGGIVGAAFTRGVLSYRAGPLVPVASNRTTVYESIRGGAHSLAPGLAPDQAVLYEAVLTFLLVQTVLKVATESGTRQRLQAAFAVGFAVLVDIAVAANVTGGSMNPARSFGPAVVFSSIDTTVWTDHWVYWAGPIIGSLVAAVFHRILFGHPGKRIFQDAEDDPI